MSVMPSSLSSRSRSAREAAAIAARSNAEGVGAGTWVSAATPVISPMEAPDAPSTRANFAKLQDVP